MPQDPIRQLLDLAAVHGFYLALLERVTGEEVPVPRGAGTEDRQGTPVDHSISVLRRWLNILDMAIAPPMFRDALKESLEPATAEALLRYYVLKTSHTDVDRDKCDFVNTYLYRQWRKSQQLSEAPAEALEILPAHILAYEGEIFIMLGEVEPPELSEDGMRRSREFEPLRQEVDDFSHFDQVMDAGIIGRARDLKASFGSAFYHPHVLAEVAVYNAFFGRRFDDLFTKAAKDIKSFAQNITDGGGSIMTRVNDEVTVKELSEVQGDEILHEEYGKARDKLRKVAQFKKVIDTKRRGRFVAPSAPAGPAVSAAAAAGATPEPSVPPAPVHNVVAIDSGQPSQPGVQVAGMMMPSATMSQRRSDDAKVQNIADVIRNFVAATDSRSFNNVAPLRNCQLLLLPHEVEAFRNPYLDEKSFRADFAELIRRPVAMLATMQIEMEDYRRKKGSAYLWKQHADSLKYFLDKTARIIEEAKEMRAL
ncbi:MAG TPA: hypothetical protein VL382_10485, partial [Terriglobales bacterium]|nr:hypothetical protein [Terriglobales bacterium]